MCVLCDLALQIEVLFLLFPIRNPTISPLSGYFLVSRKRKKHRLLLGLASVFETGIKTPFTRPVGGFAFIGNYVTG